MVCGVMWYVSASCGDVMCGVMWSVSCASYGGVSACGVWYCASCGDMSAWCDDVWCVA